VAQRVPLPSRRETRTGDSGVSVRYRPRPFPGRSAAISSGRTRRSGTPAQTASPPPPTPRGIVALRRDGLSARSPPSSPRPACRRPAGAAGRRRPSGPHTSRRSGRPRRRPQRRRARERLNAIDPAATPPGRRGRRAPRRPPPSVPAQEMRNRGCPRRGKAILPPAREPCHRADDGSEVDARAVPDSAFQAGGRGFDPRRPLCRNGPLGDAVSRRTMILSGHPGDPLSQAGCNPARRRHSRGLDSGPARAARRRTRGRTGPRPAPLTGARGGRDQERLPPLVGHQAAELLDAEVGVRDESPARFLGERPRLVNEAPRRSLRRFASCRGHTMRRRCG
jgi:hypothetical protein